FELSYLTDSKSACRRLQQFDSRGRSSFYGTVNQNDPLKMAGPNPNDTKRLQQKIYY
ncbi:MhpC, hydrolase or acyltransferase (alphabeta hydrolase superfamily), partial [Pyrenophora tritici-repentis]